MLINGVLGDLLADWKISKPDKYADLDVFKFTNSNQLMSRQLQQIYGQTSGNLANQRNQTQKSISGDVIRTAALTSVATMGLFALGVFKKAKELVIGAYNESKKLQSRIVQGYNKYVVKPVAKFRRKIYNRGVKMVRQIKRAAVKTYRRVQKVVSRPYNRVKRAVRKTYRKAKSVVHRVVKSVKKFFKRRR